MGSVGPHRRAEPDGPSSTSRTRQRVGPRQRCFLSHGLRFWIWQRDGLFTDVTPPATSTPSCRCPNASSPPSLQLCGISGLDTPALKLWPMHPNISNSVVTKVSPRTAMHVVWANTLDSFL
uniref:Uncharacterized protein n=1 Tax=Triticum urartu TaxID=4572 RepID=A0A8R7U0S4_TRIUA